MNSKRYDVIYPRNYERRDGVKQTDWLRVGVAFERQGRGIDLILYAMPVGGIDAPGEVRLVLRESDGREQGARQGGPQVEQRRPQRQSPPDAQGWPPDDQGDNIPF